MSRSQDHDPTPKESASGTESKSARNAEDDSARQAELQKAKEALLAGQVVAIPTETVYGIAASIDSEAGLKRIFEIKARPFFDPLIVHVASLKEAATLVSKWPSLADFIARNFWPGPLTLVLPKSDRVSSLITSGLETVAVRFPEHPLALELIRKVGIPLAAPSANKFGHTSPSQASHVAEEFKAEVANGSLMIIDGGPCTVGVESTVIAFGHDRSQTLTENPSPDDDYNLIRILRPGGVTREMLASALERWSHPVTLMPLRKTPASGEGVEAAMRSAPDSTLAANSSSTDSPSKVEMRDEESPGQAIASPGQMKHHYMPRVPLIILNEMMRLPFTKEQEATIRQALLHDLNDESAADAPKQISFDRIEELQLSDDPALAARELYQEMRHRSELGASCLVIYRSAQRHGGLWSAIWDRLSKAASFDFTQKSL